MFYSPFFARVSTSYCSGFEEPKARTFPSEKWFTEKRKCPSPSDTFLRLPFNNSGFKFGVPQFGHFQLNLARGSVKAAFVMAGPTVGPLIRPLIPPGIAQLIRLGVQHLIERLFHCGTHQLAKVRLNLRFIDFDRIAQVLVRLCRSTVLHHCVLSLIVKVHIHTIFPSTKERTLFINFSKCETYYTFSNPETQGRIKDKNNRKQKGV